MPYLTTFENKNILRESTFKVNWKKLRLELMIFFIFKYKMNFWWILNKLFWGGTASLNILEIYQTEPVII